jgi:hypothetical protein
MGLIKHIDDYLYEKKRDIVILEMHIQTNNKDSVFKIINRELCEADARPQINWFLEQGIKTYYAAPLEVFEGWLGHYYVDIEPNSEILKQYSKIYEDDSGISLMQEKYQLYILSYSEWVNSGKLLEYLCFKNDYYY